MRLSSFLQVIIISIRLSLLDDVIFIFYSCLNFFQGQFQLASPVPVELILALSLIITTHPHPPVASTRKVEMQIEIDDIWSVGNWWMVCLVFFGEKGQLGVALDRGDPPNPGKYVINMKLTKYSRGKLKGWLVFDFGWLKLTVITGQFGILLRQAYKKISKHGSKLVCK